MNEKEQVQAAINGKRVAIIGDVMLDRYIVGKVERMSPEAPVPILVQEKVQSRLGGAANVALNIHALGSFPIVCSIIGKDDAGTELKALLAELGNQPHYLVESQTRQTTVKTRLLGNNQHLLRLDSESKSQLTQDENDEFREQVNRLFEVERIDIVILQDYNKGLLSKDLIQHIIQTCKQKSIYVAVDPKFDNFFAYEYADLFKPNLKEITQALGRSIQPNMSDLKDASDQIMERMDLICTMITLSDQGIYINRVGEAPNLATIQKTEIVDVCGAGDAVLAVSALMLKAGLGVALVGRVANNAGKVVCQKIGVVPVRAGELIRDV